MEARNYTVEELLEATLVSSANSAAIALAENCWLRKNFVDMMRAKLLEWGIKDATVVNTTGLNNETLGDNIYRAQKKMMKTSSVLMMLLLLLVTSSKNTHKSWKSPKTFFYFCWNDNHFDQLHVRRYACLPWWF